MNKTKAPNKTKVQSPKPSSVELGYFMAFDDPVVASVLSETTDEVFNQLGLANHSMINSTALTRRVERQLKRQQTLYHDEVDTDNVELWLEANKRPPFTSKP